MSFGASNRNKGFTLVEVVMALAIFTLVFSGIVTAYIHSARRAEWTGYSLAAQALAVQQLEQARSAKWDVNDTPVVNEITNLPKRTTAVLDLPVSGGNVVIATNYISIKTVMLSTNPPTAVQLVKVATVWPFTKGSRPAYFTNTVANYFAPDR